MKGEVLKELRLKNNLSREEVAVEIYVTSEIIRSWEEGWYIITPSSDEIEGMAEMFSMSEEKLRDLIDQDKRDDYENQDHSEHASKFFENLIKLLMKND